MPRRGGARPGAGRKARDPEEKRRKLSTSVSHLSWKRLEALAVKTGKNVSQVLDELIALAAAHPVVGRLLANDGLDHSGDYDSAGAFAADAGARPTGKPKVLVIEDDAHSLELLRVRLELIGCHVLYADAIAEALALAMNERPSIVIVDLELYDDHQAGIELVRMLREQPLTSDIPIVIHSVYVRHQTELPEPLPSVEALLPKPFKLKQLRDLVARYCETDGNDATDVVII